MTRAIETLQEVAADYEAIVLDQWGVLHDGTTPYPGAVVALDALHAAGVRLAVLSNSGKRAAPNMARIARMGFPEQIFACVMTSGEALWRDVAEGRIAERRFFPIERAPGDAAIWAEGLPVQLCREPSEADAILLMGLPDGSDAADWQAPLDHALSASLPVYCSNPDRASPRSGGRRVVSPGALAHEHHARGGHVVFYGKPHGPVFDAVAAALGTTSLLMVGDSLEHDIAGAAAAGWDSAFVRGGLHAADFAGGDAERVLAGLVGDGGAAPTYMIEVLR
ncbi:MAG: TIGR01459 family HAD-type hydrolase [Pseudomonadota bacterium]